MEGKRKDPGALKAALERFSVSGPGGMSGGGIPKMTITFEVLPSACSPGVFTDAFDLTMESLSTKAEIKAANVAKGDPIVFATHLAYQSMVAFNGTPLGYTEKEWLWEALGTSGRNLVIGQFEHFNAPPEAAKNAKETLRIG